MELMDLVNFFRIFQSQNNLTQMVNFPTWIPDCDFNSPDLLDLFISSDASILFYNHVLIMLLSQFPLNFCQTHNRTTHFIP